MSAPVLPAETTPCAASSRTASMASRMLEPLALAQRLNGLVVVGDHRVGMVDGTDLLEALEAVQARGDRCLLAEEHEAQIRIADAGDVGAPDHDAGGAVAAHRIESDHDFQLAHPRAFASA